MKRFRTIISSEEFGEQTDHKAHQLAASLKAHFGSDAVSYSLGFGGDAHVVLTTDKDVDQDLHKGLVEEPIEEAPVEEPSSSNSLASAQTVSLDALPTITVQEIPDDEEDEE